MNKNIFSPKGKINRLFFAINGFILFILGTLPIVLFSITPQKTINYIICLLSVSAVLILKVFNYKKRFIDAFDISVLKAYFLAGLVIISGVLLQIHNKLLELKLQKELGLSYQNLDFPDFIGNRYLAIILATFGFIAGILWLVALFKPTEKQNTDDIQV